MKLSRRQQDALAAIVAYQKKCGWPPTVWELAFILGCGKTWAWQLLRVLEKKGAIQRGSRRQAIRIVEEP